MTRMLAVVPLLIALAACSTGGSYPPRDAADMDSEMALERRLERRLVEVWGDDAEAIRVTVDRRRAILLGDVTDRAVQELSKEVVLAFGGIDSVSNRLRLLRPSTGPGRAAARTAGEETADAALESEVKITLVGEIGRWAGAVEVEAVEGVITLRGEVPDEARRNIAMRTARGVDGVRRVIDLMTVR